MQHRSEWQKSYAHGVVLVWPPEHVRSRINPLRAAHDPVSQSWCEAHVSITPPFLVQPGEREWQAVRAALAGHEPIDITYGPVSSFDLNVIYLEVHPFAPLAALHDALLSTGLFAAPAHADFVPHMTITEGLSRIPITAELLEQLRATPPAGSFRCAELAYIRPDRDFHFTVARSLPLGASPSQPLAYG